MSFDVKSNPFLKRSVRMFYDVERYFRTPENNGVLLNTIPKSGTHLLHQYLMSMGYIDYQGFIASTPSFSMRLRSEGEVLRLMNRMMRYELMSGHIYYSSQVCRAAKDLGIPIVFLYRDPRAVFFSEINYLANMNRWHRCHSYFKKCADFDQRFDLCLNGIGTDKFHYPAFRERIKPYLGWVNEGHVLSVKFEDLIESSSSVSMLNGISSYLKKSTGSGGARFDFRPSHTSTGQSPDRWRSGLSSRQISVLNDSLADIIVQLGYRI